MPVHVGGVRPTGTDFDDDIPEWASTASAAAQIAEPPGHSLPTQPQNAFGMDHRESSMHEGGVEPTKVTMQMVQIDASDVQSNDIMEIHLRIHPSTTYETLQARIASILGRESASFQIFERGDTRQPIPSWQMVRVTCVHLKERNETQEMKEILLHVEVLTRNSDLFTQVSRHMCKYQVKEKIARALGIHANNVKLYDMRRREWFFPADLKATTHVVAMPTYRGGHRFDARFGMQRTSGVDMPPCRRQFQSTYITEEPLATEKDAGLKVDEGLFMVKVSEYSRYSEDKYGGKGIYDMELKKEQVSRYAMCGVDKYSI